MPRFSKRALKDLRDDAKMMVQSRIQVKHRRIREGGALADTTDSLRKIFSGGAGIRTASSHRVTQKRVTPC